MADCKSEGEKRKFIDVIKIMRIVFRIKFVEEFSVSFVQFLQSLDYFYFNY